MVKKIKLLNSIGVSDNPAPFITNVGDELVLEFESDIMIILQDGAGKSYCYITKAGRFVVPEKFLKETVKWKATDGRRVWIGQSIGVMTVDLSSLPDYAAAISENEKLKKQLQELQEKQKIII